MRLVTEEEQQPILITFIAVKKSYIGAAAKRTDTNHSPLGIDPLNNLHFQTLLFFTRIPVNL